MHSQAGGQLCKTIIYGVGMSRGFSANSVPAMVMDGIKSAFDIWQEMTGDWLHSAPEYLLTTQIAMSLRERIPINSRTIWMEPNVNKTVESAGGIQCGKKAARLRGDGRFDIVLGHGDGRPRVAIEVKRFLRRHSDLVHDDLHRLCFALLQGANSSHLHSGILASYTSSGDPIRGIDTSAEERIRRKFADEWKNDLSSWEWVDKGHRSKFGEQLNLKIHLDPQVVNGEAWSPVCVVVTRRRSRL